MSGFGRGRTRGGRWRRALDNGKEKCSALCNLLTSSNNKAFNPTKGLVLYSIYIDFSDVRDILSVNQPSFVYFVTHAMLHIPISLFGVQ
jgi:hypothetical protein